MQLGSLAIAVLLLSLHLSVTYDLTPPSTEILYVIITCLHCIAVTDLGINHTEQDNIT